MNYNIKVHRNVSENKDKVKLAFTIPVAYFLSLLSGVERRTIEEARIYARTTIRFLPWYSSLKGGGAITLGSAKNASITFTENFFSDDRELFKSKAYLNNVSAWLRLSSHEVTHLVHAKRFKYLFWYLIVFGYQYLRYGHDRAPLELEANRGSYEFDRFLHFTKYEMGIDFIELLFEGKVNENEQLEIIEALWNQYQRSKRSN
jgi:hypothetical protein